MGCRVRSCLALALVLARPGADVLAQRVTVVARPGTVAPIIHGIAPVSMPLPNPVAVVPAAVVMKGRATGAPGSHQVAAESYALSRVDDNVNRDPVGVTSVGVVAGATVRYATAPARPLLQLEYDAAIHRYSATARFDRVSQRLRATLARRVTRRVTLDLVTEGALKGSSEDRDVSNQLSLVPHMEIRLDNARRLRLGAAQRWRRYPTDSLQDATNRYLLAGLRQRWRGGAELEAEVRSERNMARGDRFDFRRPSASLVFGTPLGRAVRIEAGMQYRQQQYSGRFATVDRVRVVRVDRRLQPGAELVVDAGPTEVTLGFDAEWRRSNDPDKDLAQHVWQVGLRWRWY